MLLQVQFVVEWHQGCSWLSVALQLLQCPAAAGHPLGTQTQRHLLHDASAAGRAVAHIGTPRPASTSRGWPWGGVALDGLGCCWGVMAAHMQQGCTLPGHAHALRMPPSARRSQGGTCLPYHEIKRERPRWAGPCGWREGNFPLRNDHFFHKNPQNLDRVI